MGKAGFRGGNIYCANKQEGIVSVSTNASGNGTATATFRQKMPKDTYAVQLTPLQSGSEVWTTGSYMAGTRTNSGFTITLRGANTTNSSVKFSYAASVDEYK